MDLLKEIISRSKLDVKDLVAVYPYGSRVYGTANKQSDYDFIVIIKKKTNTQYSDKLININFYTPEEHQQRLNDHEISALECHFLDHKWMLFDSNHPLNKKNIEFQFQLNLPKLRQSLSAKSSNSWVKAKKKLIVEKDLDLNIGRKSLFHSIRIINYGIQIARYGKIIDYTSCNSLYKDIMEQYSWPEMVLSYKKIYNNILTEFRQLAPKEISKIM